jgi:GNAT superfamily N-acetyltransferase
MHDVAGLKIGVYSKNDSEEAIALERRCVQGTSLAVSFRRSSFHRRAENFPLWKIFTARRAGRLLGVAAAAIKDVVLLGEPTEASFYFDLRVHPEARGLGIGRRLLAAAHDWGIARASFAYTYTIADNRVAAHLAHSFGGRRVGGYRYLVYPAYRRRRARAVAAAASFDEVHAAMMATSGGFDLYSNPHCGAGSGGYVRSWIMRARGAVAGCSAWSNRGILAEVVESLPPTLLLAATLIRQWPLRLHSWPHIPGRGEELRSWYLFDFFSTEPTLARDLMRAVAGDALERGIDFCYLTHSAREAWLPVVRSDIPRLFAPNIPYHLLAKSRTNGVPDLDRIYIDVRDL